MIFHKVSFKFQAPRFKAKSQKGITLLLAILLLSSLLAISFSMATVLFIEIRTSGDLTRSEGAIYGANGIGEQAFFNLIRQVPASSCTNNTNGNCYDSQFSNNVVLYSQPVVGATSTPTFTDTVAAGTTFSNKPNIYDFSSGVATSTGSGYGQVSITYRPNGATNPLYVYLCEYDPTESVILNTNTPGYGTGGTYSSIPCTSTSSPASISNGQSTSDSYWRTDNGGAPQMVTLTSNNPLVFNLNQTKQNLQQKLFLYNPGSTAIAVAITTKNLNGTLYGLPYVGESSVSINTLNNNVGRKIQVIVPNGGNSSSSGSGGGSSAIAYDNAAEFNSSNPTNTWTNSFTVGSGSNRVLTVGFFANLGEQVPSLTVSYAGVNMTLIASVGVGPGGGHPIWYYWLANPASGTNNIVIHDAGGVFGNSVSGIDMTAVSYTGMSQSAPTNYASPGVWSSSVGNLAGGTIGGVAASLTTTVNNAWLAGVSTGGDVSYGIGTTPAGGVSGIWRAAPGSGWYAAQVLDSNGALSTGTYTMQFGQDVSGKALLVELDPASGSVNTTNYAAAVNGGIASASSQYSSSYPIADINDGDRLGNSWDSGGTGGGWNDASGPPSWAQVTFGAAKSISEVDVYTLSDNYQTVSSINASTPADVYGIQNFNVQYNNGSGWTDVPGSPITNNNLAWTQLKFSTITNVTAIRVYITAAHATYSRLVELEAY